MYTACFRGVAISVSCLREWTEAPGQSQEAEKKEKTRRPPFEAQGKPFEAQGKPFGAQGKQKAAANGS